MPSGIDTSSSGVSKSQVERSKALTGMSVAVARITGVLVVFGVGDAAE